MSTTDPDSGISVTLPGQPTIIKNTGTVDGKSIPTRTYARKFTKPNGAAAFVVMDVPAGAGPLDYDEVMKGFIQGFASASGTKASMTSTRRFDLDGHPAADGRFTFTADKGDSGVGFIRIVSDGNHVVMIETTGEARKEPTLTRIHQKMVNTLELSGSHQ
ncbi:MAG TPA: hypothetical protein VFO16_12875 [Pseudonocardiaceae bacterium]|nr:hypothetical protein [Pseudonocardiaceae bacterium]